MTTNPHALRRRARRSTALALALSALLLCLTPGSSSAQEAAEPERPARLLIVSMPGLTWDEVRGRELPNLHDFLDDAALADLAPRGVRPRSGPGDAYLTISAGTRSTTEATTDGQVLFVEEQSVGTAAGDIFSRRTGVAPTGPFVSLAWPSIERLNDAKPYDAQAGLLGTTLAEAGMATAVIGNADGTDSVGPSYERQAGLALADRIGVVAGGELGKDLLSTDPAKPFGLGLNPDAVMNAFTTAWTAAEPGGANEGGVVLVEASDLARTLRYRPLVDYSRYRALFLEALADSDALLGRLLSQVDPERDAVMVVAPYNRAGDRDLTVVALRGPGIAPGYLQSASTQRAGFLTLVDIAPTVLDMFGIDRPVEMEGRPATVEASNRSRPGRVRHLISLNDASRFREKLLTPTTTLVVLSTAALLALGMVAHTNRWGARARLAIGVLALTILAVLPASYLARLFPLEGKGTNFYWTFVLSFAVGTAVLSTVVGRLTGRHRAPLLFVLGVMAAVLVADVMTGSNLSLSAAFGYSPTGNSRLYGISNYSYGQLAAAVCFLAGWLASSIGGRRGRLAAVGVMLGALVILGVPIWGSDVGGVLAFTPSIVIFVAVLSRQRIRLRTIALGALGTLAAILVFGFIDLSRPATQRSHLGRLFERVGDEGLAPLFDLIERKLLANLAVSASSMWVAAIPVAAVLFAYLRWYPDRPYRQIEGRFVELDAAVAATFVAALLGSALNDSGAIIGGVMATVAAASLVALLMEGPGPTDPPGRDGASPSPAASGDAAERPADREEQTVSG